MKTCEHDEVMHEYGCIPTKHWAH